MATVAEYLAALCAAPIMARQIAYHRIFSEEDGKFDEPKRPLSRVMQKTLESFGIDALYTHQAHAVDAVRAGRDLVITSPTASGKSLVYTIPVLEKFLQDPDSRALYMFPLKALAQDQYKALNNMVSTWPKDARPEIAVYDGDSSDYARRKIRKNPPHILITNPDMLHLGILPWHENWTTFIASLSYIVLDEAHTYRGIFGCHMALVLRRLERICARYNASPTRILCTATVGNPLELAQNLLGIENPALIQESGAPRGKRHFVFMNPEESPSTLAIGLIKAALKRNLRTIVYCRSRRMTELISLWASEKTNSYRGKISAYRAGFLVEERRAIEERMANGDLLCVVSTSALELGIDIGHLDICILVGYPGTIMSTLQRGGRVGRKGQESAVFLLAGEDALDQYFMQNPEEFFSRPAENAILSIDNEVILDKHLECAAAEMSLRPQLFDGKWLNRESSKASLTRLCGQGLLLEDAQGTSFFAARKKPQRHVDLRGAGATFTIMERNISDAITRIKNLDASSLRTFWQDSLGQNSANNRAIKNNEVTNVEGENALHENTYAQTHTQIENTHAQIPVQIENSLAVASNDIVIGTVDLRQAYMETHEGAVYVHRGKTYHIDKVDFATKKIYAHKEKISWHTRVRTNKSTEILEEYKCDYAFSAPIGFGRLRVTEIVTGYERRLNGNLKLLDIQSLDLPPLVFETEGVWFLIPDECRNELEENYMHFMGAIHAMEHIGIGLLPLFIMADRTDLGGISTPLHPDLNSPAIFIYDGLAGGAGLTRDAFYKLEDLFCAIEKTLEVCPCEAGCPSCVISPKCGSGNRPIDKASALFLVKSIMKAAPQKYESVTKKEKTDLISDIISITSYDNNPVKKRNKDMIEIGAICTKKTEGNQASLILERAKKALTEKDDTHVMVLDVETRYSAEEVGGWGFAQNMGVSIAVLWDGKEYKHFLQEELTALFKCLENADFVIGFNTLGFDYKVLQPFADYDLWTLPSLDILSEIQKALGYRVSLENVGQATFDIGKSADGLQALRWWKEGKIDEIAHYCQKDVELTKKIWEFGRDNGYVLFNNKAGQKVRAKATWYTG